MLDGYDYNEENASMLTISITDGAHSVALTACHDRAIEHCDATGMLRPNHYDYAHAVLMTAYTNPGWEPF